MVAFPREHVAMMPNCLVIKNPARDAAARRRDRDDRGQPGGCALQRRCAESSGTGWLWDRGKHPQRSISSSGCSMRSGLRRSRMHAASRAASPSFFSTPRSTSTPASHESCPPSNPTLNFLRATDGRSNGRKSIFAHDGCGAPQSIRELVLQPESSNRIAAFRYIRRSFRQFR